ncbi:Mur ligase [Lentinula raphanica]|uniref:Folylpolyglutamate synthase n=1 Tax=Lentinula raphanica TaxID=153919 RepID=A0AA38PFS3_9AGAR|nr:Mur ligase [Lentinula raphanica]KAJ3975184.1 Mur ligase [Lentinula raphanica]
MVQIRNFFIRRSSPSLNYRSWRGMSTRTYQDAINNLNSLQSNAATLDAVRASGGRLSQFAIPEMLEYLERIGYKPDDLNALKVIHITGTKGKGSTSAFTDSIIRHTRPDWKVGLYTSPHLVAVRERIRINGRPLSEEDFTKYFFEVWDRLQANDSRKLESTPFMPGYFRFVTLMAFHSFLSLKVDATILEVGVGGTYDSTNIVPRPIVTGVTALGIDHVGVLGKTLREIAWQKGGIYKEGVPAYSVPQPEEGMQVLKERAKELKASEFTVTSGLPEINNVKIGLAGAHQVGNAILAVQLAKKFLLHLSPESVTELFPQSFVDGLQNTRWPGRCQTVADPKTTTLTWYLDGAHTVESLKCCIQWFSQPGVGLPSDSTPDQVQRVLIFNTGGGRAGPSFLESVYGELSTQLSTQSSPAQPGQSPASFFSRVVFCTNVTYADGGFKGDLTAVSLPSDDLAQLRTQNQLADAWLSIVPSFSKERVHVLPSVEHAVRVIHQLATESHSPIKVLVAGSLHLVGGVIEVAGLADVAL